jgi:hypothetical protein
MTLPRDAAERTQLSGGGYDLSHLEGLSFGHGDLPTIFPPHALFFGVIGALLLPSPALLVPMGFAVWNLWRLRATPWALGVAGVSLGLALLFLYWPVSDARHAAIIVFGLGVMALQSRLLGHGLLTGRMRVSESRRVQTLMLGFFVLALLARGSVWSALIDRQIRGQLTALEGALNDAERSRALDGLVLFSDEVRGRYGRHASFVLIEQARALRGCSAPAQRRALERWGAFRVAVAKRVTAEMLFAEERGERFVGLATPFDLDQLATGQPGAPSGPDSEGGDADE